MQINLGNGTLESLEQELLPLAIGNPQRPTYRRLARRDLREPLTFALVQRVRRASEACRVPIAPAGATPTPGTATTQDNAGRRDAETARAALARIGARAVKPLLDALADPDATQQGIAIDVLGYVDKQERGTLPALSRSRQGAPIRRCGFAP